MEKRMIIVAESGRMRSGLKALFEAASDLRITVEVCGVEVLAEACPPTAAVVVLAGSPRGMNLPRAIEHIRDRWPEAKVLVLAEDAAQWRLAKRAGADRVHFQGIAPEKLVRAVRKLLQEEREKGGGNAAELLPGTEAG